MSFAPIAPEWHKSGSYWFELIQEYARDEIYASLLMPEIGRPMSDDGAMFLAWAVALRGCGCVSPNPLVGAVLVDRNGGFVSAGAHLKVGGPHAEIDAIKRNLDPSKLQGASLFVTLEPCAHEGRTPSCAKAISQSPITRVVYGVTDPNPLVNGKGADLLLRSGKIVQRLDDWNAACRFLARVFIHNQQHQEIFTALKVASTPRGVIAGHYTKRLWITGERARQVGHFLRLEYDAILVGDQTVLLDNPSLTIRHPHVKGRNPLRLLLDPREVVIKSIRDLQVVSQEPEQTVVVLPQGSRFVNSARAAKIGVMELALDGDGHFLWSDIKTRLWAMGCRSMLIEGGAGLYRSALKAGAVNLIHWFVGMNGPDDGLTWDPPPELGDIDAARIGLKLGDDYLVERDV
jgi:diaminohydroxyphosphoribosylaminopyrimidine deaminase/5-amino-6-(5-phosphoribosylamino)uracil reductase